MEQAWFEDGHNSEFKKLYDQMWELYSKVCDKQTENYKRLGIM